MPPSSSRSSMRARTRIVPWAPLGVLACLLLLAACGGSSSTGGTTTPGATGAATISMAAASFTGTTAVTIKAGQAVTFASGGTHDLVIGTHGQFAGQNGAPSQLNTGAGLTFSPGDSKAVTFPSGGTFNITCTIHPNMQATVTVTP